MKRLILVLVAALTALASSLPVQAAHYQYSGNIMSGAQFDTYPIFLRRGDLITATLVCDQVQGGSRPLDPVLSIFLPFDPAVDTAAAVFYNDDSFGLDDDPAGVDCDAFDSARIIARAPQSGTFTFRADGFGSATGPYTLTIDTEPGYDSIPTLNEYGLILLGLLLAGFALRGLHRRQ